ncbi:MAG: DUF1653 domain-containing protein [Oceanospirillaceae bacterium]|nr:DUF1653 domain-containing protein [Oceanospirillaceae bacterium]
MQNINKFKTGLYRHYKGGEYQVIDLVKHSETEEWMVLYRPCYGEALLWVRPVAMFYEKVVDEQGKSRDRFSRIGALDPDS